ncbi:MAG: biosynthetic arginine decarboxylase [Akkermansiaceae bacterium]|nr:biosynthetic arginine decarboxylase [Akkermansiaceae bacterium]
MPHRKPSPIRRKVKNWTSSDSAELYCVPGWSNGFFDVSREGETTVRLVDSDGEFRHVSLVGIMRELSERGTEAPVLLRFRDLLRARVDELNKSFARAIRKADYQGEYRGVYPIKVNQQRQIVEEIVSYGTRYHYGLEAGSKPELMAAMAYMQDREAFLMCNGYKDDEFIDLALMGQRMGLNIYLILEMPNELPAILKRAEMLGMEPNLGVRVRLSTKGSGHWSESAGDKSVFGLNAAQVIEVVDQLKAVDKLHCLKVLHYHQGSQIPNISVIREGLSEACRMYIDLVREGAPMGTLDMGGGLAVDYDGSQTNFHSSCNYSIEEYARDVVEIVGEMCTRSKVPHPTLVTESGRAVSAYHSVLIFNILDVTSARGYGSTLPKLPENPSEVLLALDETYRMLTRKNIQECYNDANYYRETLRMQFAYGNVSLRERGIGEAIYWHIMALIARRIAEMSEIPEDLKEVSDNMVDFYYANFSLFQSLPDSWAIDQLFPVMPIQRLCERPTQKSVLVDITCDCDGKVAHYIDREDVAKSLPLHEVEGTEQYYVAVFLVGAYQETLGDIHNLLGDTNVVSVHLENGRPVFTSEEEGDCVADVLSYVKYDARELVRRFRTLAETAVEEGRISPRQRREALDAYRDGLNGYTYYEL